MIGDDVGVDVIEVSAVSESTHKKTVLSRLSELFGSGHKDVEPEKPAPESTESEPQELLLNQKQFEARLSGILSNQSAVSAGSVELINLENIRQRLGKKWGKYREMAHRVVNDAIERRLTQHDVFTQYDELSYVIIFTGLEKRQAQLKIALIAKEIAMRLLGNDEHTELVNVKSLSMKADGTAGFNEIPSVDMMVTKFRELPADHFRDEDEEARENDQSSKLSELQFIFLPMWIVKRNVISTFSCLAVRELPGGELVAGYSALDADADADQIWKLDLLTVGKVQNEFQRLFKNKITAILSIPVHFETLANRKRQEKFVSQCKALPDQLHERVIFEVVDLPSGVPDSRLAQLIGPLKPISRSVLVRLALNSRNFAGYHAAGVHAVGFDLSTESGSEREIIGEMEKFVEVANKYSLKTYVHGIRSLSLNTAAISCGFDYLDGHSLASATDQVSGVYRLNLHDLYSPLV